MAIRFACPSCRQPIEIDDNWAGQAVACPYCRHVVTAPRESNWPPADVPVASPAGSGFAPPPPPTGRPATPPPLGGAFSPPREHRAGGPSTAGWALMLAIFAGVLSVAGTMIWSFGLFELAVQQVGEDASNEQLQRTAQQIMLEGKAPISPGTVTVLLVGMICGIAALGLALRSLIRGENHAFKAIAACLIAALFVVCQGMLLLALFQQRGGGT